MSDFTIEEIIDDLSEEEIQQILKGDLKFADEINPSFLYESEDELTQLKNKQLQGA